MTYRGPEVGIENWGPAAKFTEETRWSPGMPHPDAGWNCRGTFISQGYNLIGELPAGCTIVPEIGDQFNTNPKIGRSMAHPGVPKYYPLLPGSPAIDAGDPIGCIDAHGDLLENDQRDTLRTGRCDIGAYEYLSPGSPAAIYELGGSPQRTAPNLEFWHPLETLVLDGPGSPVDGVDVFFSAPASGASAIPLRQEHIQLPFPRIGEA